MHMFQLRICGKESGPWLVGLKKWCPRIATGQARKCSQWLSIRASPNNPLHSVRFCSIDETWHALMWRPAMLEIMRHRSSTLVSCIVLASIRVWGSQKDLGSSRQFRGFPTRQLAYPLPCSRNSPTSLYDEGNATHSSARTSIPSVFARSSGSILRSRCVFEPLRAQHRVS